MNVPPHSSRAVAPFRVLPLQNALPGIVAYFPSLRKRKSRVSLKKMGFFHIHFGLPGQMPAAIPGRVFRRGTFPPYARGLLHIIFSFAGGGAQSSSGVTRAETPMPRISAALRALALTPVVPPILQI